MPDFAAVVDDFDDWATLIKHGYASNALSSQSVEPTCSDLPLFVYAESMGGAIALQVRVLVVTAVDAIARPHLFHGYTHWLYFLNPSRQREGTLTSSPEFSLWFVVLKQLTWRCQCSMQLLSCFFTRRRQCLVLILAVSLLLLLRSLESEQKAKNKVVFFVVGETDINCSTRPTMCRLICSVWPSAPLLKQKDLIDACFRDPETVCRCLRSA